MKYILALDQGTSSSRAILFDKKFKTVAVEQQEFPQYYPKENQVEQKPEEVWQSQLSVAKKLISKNNINPQDISGIGITNQRETTIVWEKKTGKPIYNAIVWQDKRTAQTCSNLRKTDWNEYITQNTGLPIDAYFSATKIAWILDNVENARTKAENGELLFGTIDTWLVWKLTNGKAHVTDVSNASRTMIFNIQNLCWDKSILKLFKIPEKMLPKVVSSSQEIATTEIFGAKIPIAGLIGDQQSALFGQAGFSEGMAKNTYGTGCFMLMNTGKKIIKSQSGLIATVAWKIGNDVAYALEGSVFIAGASIKWLRDGLKLIKSASETEKIASTTNHSENLYVVPAFSGLGAPHWNMYAKGAILGITQGITEKQIVRATLEAIAYQSKDLILAMTTDSKIPLEKMYVDGGASANEFLMQFQADILQAEVLRPQNIETTALGAAYMAAIAVGFSTLQEIENLKMNDKIFVPNTNKNKFEKMYEGWKKAVETVIFHAN